MILKKTVWLGCLLLSGCTASKTTARVTDAAAIRAHPRPVTIFAIGYWGKGFIILTLVDASQQYLTVTIRAMIL